MYKILATLQRSFKNTLQVVINVWFRKKKTLFQRKCVYWEGILNKLLFWEDRINVTR
jgi:hypothetical protein